MDCVIVGAPAGGGSTVGDPPSLTSTLMLGLWTYKGYIPSPDRKTLLIHRYDGFAISRNGGPAVEYRFTFTPNRDVQWSPDSKRFFTWNSKGDLVLFELDSIGPAGTPQPKAVLANPPGVRAGGIEWAPDGSCAFFIALVDDAKGNTCGSLQRVTFGAGGTLAGVAPILSHTAALRFFNPPTSRFQNGRGPNGDPYDIFVGAKDGCYLLSPDGKHFEQLTPATADNIDNLEWSPDSKHPKLLVNFFAPTPGQGGSTLKGTYLVHLDRRAQGKKGEQLFEQVHDKADVHTVWFSPNGKYATWVSWEGVFFREAEGKPDSVQLIAIKDQQKGIPLPVKGCSWNEAETRIAITASNRLFVYEVDGAKKLTVAHCGNDAKTFTAEPVWRGDDVIFSTFTDVAAPRVKKR